MESHSHRNDRMPETVFMVSLKYNGGKEMGFLFSNKDIITVEQCHEYFVGRFAEFCNDSCIWNGTEEGSIGIAKHVTEFMAKVEGNRYSFRYALTVGKICYAFKDPDLVLKDVCELCAQALCYLKLKGELGHEFHCEIKKEENATSAPSRVYFEAMYDGYERNEMLEIPSVEEFHYQAVEFMEYLCAGDEKIMIAQAKEIVSRVAKARGDRDIIRQQLSSLEQHCLPTEDKVSGFWLFGLGFLKLKGELGRGNYLEIKECRRSKRNRSVEPEIKLKRSPVPITTQKRKVKAET